MGDERSAYVAVGDCGHVVGVVTDGADDEFTRKAVGRWAVSGHEIRTVDLEEFRESDEPRLCDCEGEEGEDDGG